MRVIYFHQYFSLPQGSSGTRSYEFAKQLVRDGHQVTVVCCMYDGSGFKARESNHFFYSKEVVDGIQILQIKASYSNHDSFFRRSLLFCKVALAGIWMAFFERYDLLFATSTPLTIAIPGIAASVLRRKPFVFEVRDLWPELPVAMKVVRNPFLIRLLAGLEKLAYRRATALIGLAPGIVAGIKKRSAAGKKVFFIPNASDLELFTPGDGSQLVQDRLEAVFTGAHGMANGLDALLDAARVLQNRGRDDIGITLIGDGKLKPSLVKRAANEGLRNVSFEDPLPKLALSKRMAECSVGLMILKNVREFYEGTSPNKFFDYLASGLVVVANYPGWLAEEVEAANCGISVAPEDPDALADALVRLADDRTLLGQYSRRSRQLAEERFSRDEASKAFVAVLEDTWSEWQTSKK